MNLEKCFFCGKLVLGLKGQDTKFDSYLLGDTPEDASVIKKMLFGECHLYCLAHSEWSLFWYNRRLKTNLDCGGKLVFQTLNYSIISVERAGQIIYLHENGNIISLTRDSRFISVQNQIFISVIAELNLDLTQLREIAARVKCEIQLASKYKLRQLIDELGLDACLNDPLAVLSGTLTPNKNTLQLIEKGWLTCQINYLQRLPEFFFNNLTEMGIITDINGKMEVYPRIKIQK